MKTFTLLTESFIFLLDFTLSALLVTLLFSSSGIQFSIPAFTLGYAVAHTFKLLIKPYLTKKLNYYDN